MANADRIIELLHEAKARPAGAERDHFLAEACRDDAALKDQIVSLLQAEAGDDGSFLKITPAIRQPILPTEKPGDRIGRYKLLQQIGEGGCGVVYMAEQEEPVRRRVALKVIKLGMDTKSVIARFEAERQALAMMDHPSIARVFDAGATDTGRPYFVMELVRGIKITDYCDQNNLSTEERLRLFTQVCHAIQHAHQKSIIHRDIKPSNVLVTVSEPGAAGCPKVIDFGIAKATNDQRLTDKTIFTAFEQFIGTPAYMSPEQAMMTSLDIDTRTDIYALGVLLYELLTGQTPFDAVELMASGLDAMRRIIREQEPARPSTRLSTMLAAELTTVARHRHAEPARLGTLLSGDLDWIVMKALEKERSRRYETASGLAADVQRHLTNEPVIARPPSAGYRFQKLIRRNKLAFAAMAAVTVALLLGMVGSAWQASRATRAEQEQTALRQKADEARVRAEAEQKKAETEAARSRQVAQFLQDMLKGVGPSVAVGRDTSLLKEILDNTAARVGKDMAGQPEVEADLRSTIGSVYRELGEFRKQESMCREALAIRRKIFGPEHPDVADSLVSLGNALYEQQRFVEAEAANREALAMRINLFGSEHPAVASSLGSMGNMMRVQGRLPEAEAMHRQVLAMRRKLFGDEHLEVAAALKSLAFDLNSQGKAAESEQLHRESLAIRRKHLGNDHLEVAGSISLIADALVAQGKMDQAETLYRESIALRRKLDPEHPALARLLVAFARLFLVEHDDKLQDAETFYREALDILKKRPGGEHPDFAECSRALGTVLCIQGKLPAAEALFRDLIAQFEQASSGSPASTERWRIHAWNHHQLGILLRNTGREAEAGTALQKASAIWREHPDQARIDRARREVEAKPERGLQQLGEAYLAAGEWTAAVEIYTQIAQIGGSAWQWLPLAIAHQQLAQTNEARFWFEKSLAWMDAHPETRLRLRLSEVAMTVGLPDPWERSRKASNHSKEGDAFQHQGENEKATEAYVHAIRLYDSLVADFPAVPGYRNRLSALMRKIGRLAETEIVVRETLEMQRKLLGNQHSEVAAMLHKLGHLLRDQGNLAEAETLFREAIASLDQLVRKNPESADYRVRRGHSQWQLGGVLSDTSRYDEAELVHREALRGFEQAARDFPTNLFFRQEQAFSHRLLAGVAKTRQRVDEARRHYQAAVGLYAALAVEMPQNALYPRERDLTSNLEQMLQQPARPTETPR